MDTTQTPRPSVPSRDSVAQSDSVSQSPVARYIASLPLAPDTVPRLEADVAYWNSFLSRADTLQKAFDQRLELRDTNPLAGAAVAASEAAAQAVVTARAEVRGRVAGGFGARGGAARTGKEPVPGQGTVVFDRSRATMKPPQIQAIVERRLTLDSVVIVVQRNRSADKIWGLATCAGATPVVYLAVKPSTHLNDYAVLFVREHEVAHHSLGHVDCKRGKRFRTGLSDEEYLADCEAVRVLRSFPQGLRVIDRTYSVLEGMSDGDSEDHPSSSHRAKHIDDVCITD